MSVMITNDVDVVRFELFFLGECCSALWGRVGVKFGESRIGESQSGFQLLDVADYMIDLY